MIWGKISKNSWSVAVCNEGPMSCSMQKIMEYNLNSISQVEESTRKFSMRIFTKYSCFASTSLAQNPMNFFRVVV